MKKVIVFLASSPWTVSSFMSPHIRLLCNYYDIKVFANTSESELLRKLGIDVSVISIPVVRNISLVEDVFALFLLCLYFIRFRPLAIHTITPKAGLLGMIAAWITRVPLRIHSFTGQVWVTRSGPMRWFLKSIDTFMGFLATEILVDSPSQLEFLLQQGVVKCSSSQVLGSGSICGVDTQRFSPSKFIRDAVRFENKTPSSSFVCLYLGRLSRDKGVLLLAEAFCQVSNLFPDAELWIVGPDEAECFSEILFLLGNSSAKVKRFGLTAEPERFMQAADLFCLPSYREGFGTSVIEAASCGVPSLVSRIYGLTDAVIEGETGWMHEVGNVKDLIYQLSIVLSNPSELLVRGKAARQYVVSEFSEQLVTSLMHDFYSKRSESMV